MPSSQVLDSTDRRILDVLRVSADATQSEIAKALNLSQPAVANRIRRMKSQKLLITRVGIDVKKLGLIVGKMTLTAREPARLLSRFQACPCLVGGLVTSGDRNVALFFAAENPTSLEGIVDEHLRKDPNVQDVDFGLVVRGLSQFAICPSLSFDLREETPCGGLCSNCLQYKTEQCFGCPATIYYRGNFWNNVRQHNRVEPVPAL
jgi:Lrp/AsnC family leucine-responsive transcriptional regulator